MNGQETFGRIKQVVFSVVPNLKDPVLYDDLMSEGMVGYAEACQTYKDDRGASFWTYAHYRIRGRILNQLNQRSTRFRFVCSSKGSEPLDQAGQSDNAPLPPPGISSRPPARSYESRLTARDAARLISSGLQKLSSLERRLLCRCVLRQQTIYSVCEKMGINRRRGARLVSRAMEKLREDLERKGYCLEDFI